MTTRERLHRLVDDLSDDEAAEARGNWATARRLVIEAVIRV
jgi:hypothetical protein